MSGPSRYEQGRLLGGGASGLVYEALDRALGERVAVKRLRREGPLDVARLKHEFRTLADVHHANLVRLHGLLQEGDELVLAMDLVEGRSLLDWVWDVRGADAARRVSDGRTWSTMSGDDLRAPQPLDHLPPSDPATLERLGRALRGLAAGLSALHACGLLHRDVKPSNVIVTDEGHVVVVDFGLAMRPGKVEDIAGTVAYMAPEQLLEGELTPAIDWYAFGVVLFEALTGRTPFVGASVQILFAKQANEAPPVREFAPDAPAELCALCDALLARDPARRPLGEEVAARLQGSVSAPKPLLPFVGRVAELAKLQEAWAAPGVRAAYVVAPSGLGKTRLVERFLQTLPADTMVHSGRCYEREHAPYKAIDPLVAAMVDAAPWGRGPPPDSVDDAARLFPVLATLASVDVAPASGDPGGMWDRAVVGLRALLVWVAADRPTVLWIDDVQWADADGLRLLADVVRGVRDGALLLVLAWRSEDPRVEDLLDPLHFVPSTLVAVQPLDATAARELVVGAGAVPDASVDRLVAEAGGSPFFLAEAAQWGGSTPGGIIAVLRSRFGALSEASRSLLQIVAVAGRPVAPDVALGAARLLDPAAGTGDIVLLTTGRLLTSRRGDALECTHDQIREAASGDLDVAQRRRHHHALATTLGEWADPELLADHWAHAGEDARALKFMVLAAERAESALAFERAADWYRRARALPGAPADLQIRLGRVLARAGRGEAADELLGAAATAEPKVAIQLEREASHQLLRTGRYERAFELLPRVVAEVGLRWPRTRFGALMSVLGDTVTSRLGWPRLRPNPAGLALASELAMSLSYADLLRSAVYSARAIRLAEASGVPAFRAVAAAMRASNATLLGEVEEGALWWARAVAIGGELTGDRTEVDLALRLHGGIRLAVLGQTDAAAPELEAVAIDLVSHGGRPYEVGMARTFLTYARLQSGDLIGFRQLRSDVIEQARARGDKHLEVLFRVSFALQPGLIDDDPAGVEANLREAESQWGEGISTAWLYTEVSHAQLDVYRGRHPEALTRLLAAASAAGRGGLLRITLNALILHIALASAATPLAAADRSARTVLERALRDLDRVKNPMAPSCAAVWRSGLASLDGDPAAALGACDFALARLAEVPVAWLSPMVRARRAVLAGTDPAPALEALRQLGIRNPMRLSALYVPSISE